MWWSEHHSQYTCWSLKQYSYKVIVIENPWWIYMASGLRANMVDMDVRAPLPIYMVIEAYQDSWLLKHIKIHDYWSTMWKYMVIETWCPIYASTCTFISLCLLIVTLWAHLSYIFIGCSLKIVCVLKPAIELLIACFPDFLLYIWLLYWFYSVGHVVLVFLVLFACPVYVQLYFVAFSCWAL